MKRNAARVTQLEEDQDPNLAPINESSIRFPKLADLKGSENPHRGLEIAPEMLEDGTGAVELDSLEDQEGSNAHEPVTDISEPEPAPRPRRENSPEFDTGGITLTNHSDPEPTNPHPPEPSVDATAVANSSIILVHESTGKKIRIFDGLTIGRNEGNENFPQDSLISRKHCRLSYSEDKRRILIRDLDVTNPSKVNGTELRRGEELSLRVGDTIEVGNQRLAIIESNTTRSAFEDLPFPVNRRNGVVFMPAREATSPGMPQPLSPAQFTGLPLAPQESPAEAAVPSLFHPATWDTTSLVSAGLLLIVYGASVVSYLAQMNEVTSPLHDPGRLRIGMLSSLLWPTGLTILFLYRFLNFECKNWLSKATALLAGFWIYVLSSYAATRQDRAIYRIEANTINEFCIAHFDEARCNNSLERLSRKTSTVAEALKELPDGSRARVVGLIEDLRPAAMEAPAQQTSAAAGKMPL